MLCHSFDNSAVAITFVIQAITQRGDGMTYIYVDSCRTRRNLFSHDFAAPLTKSHQQVCCGSQVSVHSYWLPVATGKASDWSQTWPSLSFMMSWIVKQVSRWQTEVTAVIAYVCYDNTFVVTAWQNMSALCPVLSLKVGIQGFWEKCCNRPHFGLLYEHHH